MKRNIFKEDGIKLTTLRDKKPQPKKWLDGTYELTLPELIDNSETVQEFLSNAQEIERLKGQIKELETENNAFKKELSPYMKELEKASMRIAEGKHLVLSLKKSSYSTLTVPYQSALELAFEHLNESAKELVNQFLEDNAKLTEVASSFEISLKENIVRENIKRGNIRESFFSKLKDMLYSYFRKAAQKISKIFFDIDSSLYEIEKIVSKIK
jgi:seryl-tRNA synthetase